MNERLNHGVYIREVPVQVSNDYEVLRKLLKDKHDKDAEKTVNAVRTVREMKPIVLPLDAAWMFGTDIAVWPEVKTGDGQAFLLAPCMISIIYDDSNGGILVGIMNQGMRMYPNSYGKDYRVWLGKPSEEQRKAVPWE